MNVRVHVLYEAVNDAARESLLSLGRSLTNDPQSVRFVARANASRWLVVEFTMPTEAQYKAVERIDRAIRYHADDRQDSAIEFPKTEAERERSRRKTARRRARRRLSDADGSA